MAERDPQIRLRASDDLLSRPVALRRNSPEIAAAARQVLRHSPLDARAMRQLGLVAELGRPGSGFAAYALAERISRRDLPTELALIDATARQGAAATVTLRHFDHALSVYPSVAAQLFGPLASELGDADVRKALAAYAARPWLRTFLSEAPDHDVAPHALMDFYAELSGKVPAAPMQAGAVRMVAWLAANGQHAALAGFAASMPGLAPGALEPIGFTPVTTDPALAPLSWKLRNDEEVAAEPEADGLAIRIAPESTAIAASRLTFLRPGSYAIGQAIAFAPGVPHARLEWEVACLGAPDAPIWQAALPGKDTVATDLAAPLVVPAACPAQQWRLRAAGEGSQFAAAATISGLAARRL